MKRIICLIILLLTACAAPLATHTPTPHVVDMYIPTVQAAASSETSETTCSMSVIGYQTTITPGTSVTYFEESKGIVVKTCVPKADANSEVFESVSSVAEVLMSGSCYAAVHINDLSFTAYQSPDESSSSLIMKNGTYFIHGETKDGWHRMLFEGNAYYIQADKVVFLDISCP
jgi:hypothetical protein